ncbi:hypothetical protein K1719_025715 [Acacia pycnantha]|nr:hypothetical protein K1719_025715 [Acacia pycnantha]
MDGSAMELSPNNLGTPKRRNARRKMVQSTLLPQKTQESDHTVDDQQVEEEAYCCANENRKGKSKLKVTPRTKNSKQKDRQLQNTTPENMGTPKRRNVRRKLVQSTFSPQKTQESDDRADEKEENNCFDDQQEKEEAHCCANENDKGKSNDKATPPSKNSKKKEKQLQNTTPKKRSPKGVKGASSRQMLTNVAQINMTVPDLRLEAKLSAEENSRMFAGRQIHPFFSSWKVGKKPQELAESGQSLCAARRKYGEVLACAPIHVFENNQDADDTSSPVWKNWTFWGHTAKEYCGPESSFAPVFEGSIDPLNIDKLSSTFYPSGVTISQNTLSCSDQHSTESTPPQVENSAALAGGQTSLQSLEAKLDMKADTEQAGFFRKTDPEPQSRYLQESMRSYYHSCGAKTEGTLWTYKYKPTKAFEVCGNDESVKFLRDWLQLWHGRRYQSKKDSLYRDKGDMQGDDNDDADYDCSHCDYDSEDMTEEDSLENVLLITGPAGSGKSAAVYACAQEEGFEVLELNASDWRNGTTVRQHFGDALGSLGVKRLLEHTDSSPMKKKSKLSSGLALPINKASDGLNEGVIGPITISDDEAVSPGATSWMLPKQRNSIRYDNVQKLILFEDVDILFPEDRGFIAAIQQIAETAKGPIVLTCNSNNPPLPDNFNRLHISFSLPSTKELLCHLYMVCVTEGVNIHPLVLEKFIQSCDGDIRKTMMHLQFWFQSKRLRKDRKAQKSYGSLPFDLEVGHQILPKMMPWEFPSQLSELIEKEVTKVITTMEENSSLQGLVEEQLDVNEKQSDSDVQQTGTDYIEAKKVEMLERNGSVTDYIDWEAQFHALSEISNSSCSPMAPSKQKIQRKLVVMSSGSEDEDLNNGHPLDMCDDANNGPPLEENSDSPSKFPTNNKHTSVSFLRLGTGLEESVDLSKHLGAADDTCLNETSKSFDVSCVPESTFVPETVNEVETISGAVSCGNLADPLEVSVNNESLPSTFSVRKCLAKRARDDDLLGSNKIPESSREEIVQDFIDENMETTPAYNVMDECSRIDFKTKSNFVEPFPSMGTDFMHKLWRELRECRTDLRQHAATEQPGAFQVVKLACGMSNLISEADLLFGNFQQKNFDVLEAPTSLSNESTFNWYDEQMMVSTVAEHGFCFYAKHLSDMGLKSSCENCVDLTSEMLASTTDIMALGYLSRQGLTNPCNGKDLENKSRNDLPDSQMQTSLFNVVQSVVPKRSSSAPKGVAFNEYLSSLRLIAGLEDLRISKSAAEKTRRRRVRGSQHYLSKGTMSLSCEDISLLCEGDLYRKTFSKYIGASNKVDGNFT